MGGGENKKLQPGDLGTWERGGVGRKTRPLAAKPKKGKTLRHSGFPGDHSTQY